MRMTRKFRVAASLAGLMAATLSLAGCVGGPTYGTDKTANEQLMSDLGNAVMLQPGNGEAKKIAYQPRGDLVLPKDDTKLIQPQESVASKDNPQWAESPEEIRDRLKEEATLNERSATYQSPLQRQSVVAGDLSTKQQIEQYREARKTQQGLYADKRRYLSDPPLEYRALPAEAAADLGEPEKDKERRRLKEAKAAKQSGSSWWPF